MYCRKCGAENPDNGVFCAKCGERLASGNATGVQAVVQPPKKKGGMGKKIAIIAIPLFVIAIIGILATIGNNIASEPDEPEQVKVLFDVPGLIDPETRMFLTREQIEEKYGAEELPENTYRIPNSIYADSIDVTFIFAVNDGRFRQLAGLSDFDDYSCKREDIPAVFGLDAAQCVMTKEDAIGASQLLPKTEGHRDDIVEISYSCTNFGADIPVTLHVSYDTVREVICSYHIYNDTV